MTMFWWGFGTALLLVAVLYGLYNWLIPKFFGVMWYQVVEVNQSNSSKDVWNVSFLLDNQHIYYGYCKKRPPQDVDPKQLRVRIKHFNEKRGLYHVHWEVIPADDKKTSSEH